MAGNFDISQLWLKDINKNGREKFQDWYRQFLKQYNEHPITRLVGYSNGLFQLEQGILIPNHSKTGHVNFEWAINPDRFKHKKIIQYFYFVQNGPA